MPLKKNKIKLNSSVKHAVALLYDIKATVISVNVELRGVFAPNRKALFRVRFWSNTPEVHTVREHIKYVSCV
jgi:hypothetical protein